MVEQDWGPGYLSHLSAALHTPEQCNFLRTCKTWRGAPLLGKKIIPSPVFREIGCSRLRSFSSWQILKKDMPGTPLDFASNWHFVKCCHQPELRLPISDLKTKQNIQGNNTAKKGGGRRNIKLCQFRFFFFALVWHVSDLCPCNKTNMIFFFLIQCIATHALHCP